MAEQIALFNITEAPDPRGAHGKIDLLAYGTYIIAVSGGKDSISSVLHLLEQGVPRHKIELFHHRIDGSPNAPPRIRLGGHGRLRESVCRGVRSAAVL